MGRTTRAALCGVLLLCLVALSSTPAGAQAGGLQELLNNLLKPPPAQPPAPPAPPPPAAPPPPPAPAGAKAPAPPPPTAAQAKAAAAAAAAEARSGPFPLAVPRIKRSPPRSTATLLARLQPVLQKGLPLQTALLRVVSPFPVAGAANFSHDWGLPRWTPTPHLHQGTDIFAAFGTPIVTSESGTVIAKNTVGAGGISAWVRGDSGMAYYYAHMQGWVKGLSVGQRVEKGAIIGFVGNSGNAEDGSSHLHFEMHPGGSPGTPARDPKPFLDDALRQAEEQALALAGGTPAGTVASTLLPSVALPITRREDKLLAAASMRAPGDLMWFSVLEPALGVMGLARRAAVDAGLPARELTPAQAREEQRLEDVKRAVLARQERISTLARTSQNQAVVVGPLAQALVR